jgi:hypothetical protein
MGSPRGYCKDLRFSVHPEFAMPGQHDGRMDKTLLQAICTSNAKKAMLMLGQLARLCTHSGHSLGKTARWEVQTTLSIHTCDAKTLQITCLLVH